jgi:hypothetical protein
MRSSAELVVIEQDSEAVIVRRQVGATSAPPGVA